MGNGTWNGSSAGGYAGSYGTGGGNSSYGFPYPGGSSGWEWSGSEGKGAWQPDAWFGGGGGKGNGTWDSGNSWGADAWGNGQNNSAWGNGQGVSANGNGNHVSAVPAGKGRGKPVAGTEREEECEASFSNGRVKAQDHRINGHGHAPLQEERAHPRILPRDNGDNSDSDNGDPLPPGASEAEIEEARVIVEKAQRQLAERDKMKKAAVGASRDDLQAMINKRMMQK